MICEWLLERVKERVQVWKREWYEDVTCFGGKDGEGVEGKGNKSKEEKAGRITNGRRTFLVNDVVSSFAFVVAVVIFRSVYSVRKS
jgi:hypothetical protein